jgi:hypothetical protein
MSNKNASTYSKYHPDLRLEHALLGLENFAQDEQVQYAMSKENESAYSKYQPNLQLEHAFPMLENFGQDE